MQKTQTMKNVNIIVERGKDGIAIYTEDAQVSGFGSTIKEAEEDFRISAKLLVESATESSFTYNTNLAGEYELAFSFDVRSFLEYYSSILTRSALSRLTGINERQLGHYIQGVSKPRKSQIEKIEQALHNLGNELSSISLM
jgi:hypothetical protein